MMILNTITTTIATTIVTTIVINIAIIIAIITTITIIMPKEDAFVKLKWKNYKAYFINFRIIPFQINLLLRM